MHIYPHYSEKTLNFFVRAGKWHAAIDSPLQVRPNYLADMPSASEVIRRSPSLTRSHARLGLFDSA